MPLHFSLSLLLLGCPLTTPPALALPVLISCSSVADSSSCCSALVCQPLPPPPRPSAAATVGGSSSGVGAQPSLLSAAAAAAPPPRPPPLCFRTRVLPTSRHPLPVCFPRPLLWRAWASRAELQRWGNRNWLNGDPRGPSSLPPPPFQLRRGLFWPPSLAVRRLEVVSLRCAYSWRYVLMVCCVWIP